MSIKSLIKPRSYAVIGASSRRGSFGNFAAANAVQCDPETTNVYFVNNKGEDIMGRPSYKSLADLPEVPDCVMICTPKQTVPGLLTQAGEMGVKAAIIVASGYSEEDTEQGRKDEAELAEIIKKYDMKVMGPNCTGFLNNIDKVKAWGMGGTDFDMKTRKTGAATFANSGTMALNTLGCSYLNISYAFSAGNCAFLTIEEILEEIIEEDEVTIIGMYLEGSKDPARLIKCLKRAAELGKPVVIHAAGMSDKGAKSAASHTGNLASSRGVYEAIFRKYGVIMVENTDEYLCALDALSVMHGKMPKAAKFSAFNSSGGENTVCADMSEKWGVPMLDFEPETIAKLKEVLPGYASPKNPLDATALPGAPAEWYVNLYNIVGSDPNVEAILITNPFNAPDEKWAAMNKVFGSSMNDRTGNPVLAYQALPNSVPMIVMPPSEERRDPEWRAKLAEAHVPIMANSNNGYNVLGKIAKYIEYDKSMRTFDYAVPDLPPVKETVALTEYDSKKALADFGIEVPKQFVAASLEEMEAGLKDFSYPIVLKVSSQDILHKTEAGGVKIKIQNLDEAKKAYADIMASCKAYKPDARIDGMLVTEMAKPGVEMILGITSDPKFGPMLMVGMGGVFTEVFKDVALYPCPLAKAEAMEMLQSLKSYKLLQGYRGSAPCDIDALAELMVKVSQFAQANKNDVKELDINPVFVYPKGEGLSVVDALLVKYQR